MYIFYKQYKWLTILYGESHYVYTNNSLNVLFINPNFNLDTMLH
jgi:hypothetical protein